ncbi:hypothetical protein TELCIR_14154 [Teladorsagia circumcincta]|uniref:Major facilitator superfamily (MFS) profile domain-containing protein n=1 Tax=Teladorsagia circumcincta TaxID=45464 RepID=A0A2G9U1V0_TELCI|nr:hypothetical protein TELCIR_14154 [Teladorsagia circumcincta]
MMPKFYYDISYDDDDEAIQEYWDMVPEYVRGCVIYQGAHTLSTCSRFSLLNYSDSTGAATRVAVAVNWICSMISTLVYYPLNESVGGWSYLFFIIPTSFFLLILYFFLPETRFHYRADPTESRLLVDLGPPNPYGTFADESDDLF